MTTDTKRTTFFNVINNWDDRTLSWGFYGSANPGYGQEPEVLGKLFTMKKGTLSEPLQGKTAVFVIAVQDFIEPAVTTDYSSVKEQILSNYKSRVGYDIYTTLEKNTKITDNRILFF